MSWSEDWLKTLVLIVLKAKFVQKYIETSFRFLTTLLQNLISQFKDIKHFWTLFLFQLQIELFKLCWCVGMCRWSRLSSTCTTGRSLLSCKCASTSTTSTSSRARCSTSTTSSQNSTTASETSVVVLTLSMFNPQHYLFTPSHLGSPFFFIFLKLFYHIFLHPRFW